MSESTYPSVKDLTLEEKASLTSGGDAWHLQGVESKGIPGYMITDGPHGLRKSLASSAGETDLDDSVPATCFPPAAGLSSSWNPELIHKVGEAMAEECIQEKVAVILGPGVNIKRNPLGGRCFEYWSEDPYLAGHEAIGIVEGVQSKGVGTSLKHFAANNQESDRLRVDARISPRALREILLPGLRVHRQESSAVDHHVLLQPHQRRAFRTEPLAADQRAARRMGLRGHRHVRLGRRS